MRVLSSAAFSILLLPSCINLDLKNGQAQVFEAEVDANGAGFRKKNIKFKQIVTIDPTTDEQRAGAVGVDQINFEPISIEFSYLLEEMNVLEEAVALQELNNNDVITDPRGTLDFADANIFQVGDNRMQPFIVQMFTTFTRKEIILEERRLFEGKFKKRRVRSIESEPAFCNFLDANGQACFTFDASPLGVNIGRVAGVGKDQNNDGVLENIDEDFDGIDDVIEIENTTAATFNDLIAVDPVIYMTLLEEFTEANAGQPLNADQIAQIAEEAVMIRIARDAAGVINVFNNNLGEDFR